MTFQLYPNKVVSLASNYSKEGSSKSSNIMKTMSGEWGNWTLISCVTDRHINHYTTHPILYWVRDLNSSLQIESLMNWPPILTQHLCTPYRNRTYILSLEDSCTIHCTKRVFIVAIRGFEPLLQEPKSCVTTITPDSNIKEKGILLNTMV